MSAKGLKTVLSRSILISALAAALTVVPVCADSYRRVLQKEYSGSTEKASLQVFDSQNQLLWSLTSVSPAVQLSQYALLESDNDIVYFVDAGIVTAYDAATGTVIWTNPEFGGSVPKDGYVIEDGAVYLCGSFGPDYCLISSNGATISRVDELNEGVYWPYEMHLDENQDICITFESDGSTHTVPRAAYINYVELPESTPKRGTALHVVNCNEYISLRNSADGDGEVIATMPKGSVCTLLTVLQNGFCYVHYTSGTESVNGYAYADYLSE